MANLSEEFWLDKKCVVLEEEIQKTKASYELTNELMKEGEVSSLSVNQFLSREMKLEEMLLEARQKMALLDTWMCFPLMNIIWTVN